MSAEQSSATNATHAEVEALTQMCGAYAVPIILQRGTGRQQVVGSGISFRKENRQFIITAAHVVNGFAPDLSLVTIPNQPQPSYTERLHVIGTYKHSSSDIAVVELADPLPQSACDEDHCVHMAELSQHPDVRKVTFFVHGFPSDSQEVSKLLPRVLLCTRVYVPTNYREMRDGPYGGYHEYHGPAIILEYGPEIWERYQMEYYSKFGNEHRPFGLSGGGVWYVRMNGEGLLTPSDTVKLVGIQSHVVKNDHLIVVPITEALELIDHDILG
jgi:hypothetical protein